MKILASNIDVTDKKKVYKLTKGESQRVQDLETGVTMQVDSFALYEETKLDRNGEEKTQTVLSIVSGGMKISTISKTFIDSFMEIVDLMEGEPFAITITGGISKGGRQYVDCEMFCD